MHIIKSEYKGPPRNEQMKSIEALTSGAGNSLRTLSPNNTSPRGLQRPQRQAKKPDYLRDSPANVYFLSLSVVFFFTMQAMARLSFLLSEQRIRTSKLYLPRVQWKMKLPQIMLEVVPKFTQFLPHFFSKWFPVFFSHIIANSKFMLIISKTKIVTLTNT